jgi:hypothetical protein
MQAKMVVRGLRRVRELDDVRTAIGKKLEAIERLRE